MGFRDFASGTPGRSMRLNAVWVLHNHPQAIPVMISHRVSRKYGCTATTNYHYMLDLPLITAHFQYSQ